MQSLSKSIAAYFEPPTPKILALQSVKSTLANYHYIALSCQVALSKNSGQVLKFGSPKVLEKAPKGNIKQHPPESHIGTLEGVVIYFPLGLSRTKMDLFLSCA